MYEPLLLFYHGLVRQKTCWPIKVVCNRSRLCTAVIDRPQLPPLGDRVTTRMVEIIHFSKRACDSERFYLLAAKEP